MKILVVTDAFRPQVNGVVRSLEQMAAAAAGFGVTIEFLAPAGFPTVPLPSYPEIRLALATPLQIRRRIAAAAADFIHIATEGPLGFLARRACLVDGRPFTTSYHTRFPEYIAARAPVPQDFTYRCLRQFHNAGSGTMVSTPAMERELAARGFLRLMRWSRGVDHDLFRPRPPEESPFDLPRPVFLSVGRVAVEKNIEAFLSLDLPGSKVVVGDGPALAGLRQRHPTVHFTGLLEGEALARVYAGADAFVFPSLTDTFGIVLLEALASGLPVAAFPVTGPLDVVGTSKAGVLSPDLRAAALACLDIPREVPRHEALRHTWEASARQFVANVERACGAPWPHAPERIAA